MVSERPSTASSQRSSEGSVDLALPPPAASHAATGLTKLADLGLVSRESGRIGSIGANGRSRLEGGLTARKVTTTEWNPVTGATRTVTTAKPPISTSAPNASKVLHGAQTANNYEQVLRENPKAFHKLTGPCGNAVEVLGGNQRDSVPGHKEALSSNTKAFHRPVGEFSQFLDQARLYRFNYLDRGWKIDLPDSEKRDEGIAIDDELKGVKEKKRPGWNARTHTPHGSRRPYSAPAPRKPAPSASSSRPTTASRKRGLASKRATSAMLHPSDDMTAATARMSSRERPSSSRSHMSSSHGRSQRPQTAGARVPHRSSSRHDITQHTLELTFEKLQNGQGIRLSPRAQSASGRPPRAQGKPSSREPSARRHQPNETEARTRDRRRVQSARRRKEAEGEEGGMESTLNRHRRLSIASSRASSRPSSRASSRASSYAGARLQRSYSTASSHHSRASSAMPSWAAQETRESTMEEEREAKRSVVEDLDDFDSRLKAFKRKQDRAERQASRSRREGGDGVDVHKNVQLSYTLRQPSSVTSTPTSGRRQT